MYPGVRTDCYALQTKICDLPPVFTALFSKTPVKIRYPRSYDFIKITVFSHALRVFPVTFGIKSIICRNRQSLQYPSLPIIQIIYKYKTVLLAEPPVFIIYQGHKPENTTCLHGSDFYGLMTLPPNMSIKAERMLRDMRILERIV